PVIVFNLTIDTSVRLNVWHEFLIAALFPLQGTNLFFGFWILDELLGYLAGGLAKKGLNTQFFGQLKEVIFGIKVD
ncbi:hypothetical protein ACJX0J_007680, partial [Zea mays]